MKPLFFYRLSDSAPRCRISSTFSTAAPTPIPVVYSRRISSMITLRRPYRTVSLCAGRQRDPYKSSRPCTDASDNNGNYIFRVSGRPKLRTLRGQVVEWILTRETHYCVVQGLVSRLSWPQVYTATVQN